jgi:UDP-glucose 4-epimerase
MPTIAITGGSGFIGSTLAQRLSNSFKVRNLDMRKPPSGESANIEFVECDVRSHDGVQKALDGVDLVIHTSIIQIPQVNDDKRMGYEVNVRGTENVCEAVRNSLSLKGMILTGSWHTIGEKEITGVVDERFGFRPDMVEDRARVYALSKIAQEVIVRLHDEESRDKIYGIIRSGTVLGERMPEKTAASIFIEQALKGQPMTPYEHSMHRSMLYVDVLDICRAFESYARRILAGTITKTGNSLGEIVNVYYPQPITILELAELVKKSVTKCSKGRINPEVKIIRTGERTSFTPQDKARMKVDVSRSKQLLGLERMANPADVIERIVDRRISRTQAK